MKRELRSSLVFTLSLSLTLAVCSAAAHAATPAAAPAVPIAKSTFQIDLIAQLYDARKKVMALEDAVPQSKFTWRPAPGVRSIAEAYLHIAFGNYATIKFATGKEPPADAGWEMNIDKWDKHTTDKAEIKKALEESFDHTREAVKALSDADLEKKVNFFGTEMTARALLIGLVGHVNEHLGQSIAYARMNKIVPPWSMKGKDGDKDKGQAKDKGKDKDKDKM